METATIEHHPSFLKMAVKESNMILSRTNRDFTITSGPSGYGTAKSELECEISSKDLIDYSTLQLRGRIKVLGDDVKPMFCGSAYSLLKNLNIECNGTNINNINQDAGHVAQAFRTLKSTLSEYENDAVLALEDVEINNTDAGSLSFAINLNKYQGALKYFFLTAPVCTLKIRIGFETDLAKVFYKPVSDPVSALAITGYQVDDCRINSDVIKPSPEAFEHLLNNLRSESGVTMFSHNVAPRREVLTNTLNHSIRNVFQYRNLVSMYYLPVPTSIPAASKHQGGINKVDIIGVAQYAGGAFPKDFRVSMGGSGYVNQNAEKGCNNKMDFLSGTLKALKSNPDDGGEGYYVCQGYKNNSYQIIGVSFVRGNEDEVIMAKSGINSFLSRGNLETDFACAALQPNTSLLCLGVYTNTVEFKKGQIRVYQ